VMASLGQSLARVLPLVGAGMITIHGLSSNGCSIPKNAKIARPA
jgi:hypothetical protein